MNMFVLPGPGFRQVIEVEQHNDDTLGGRQRGDCLTHPGGFLVNFDLALRARTHIAVKPFTEFKQVPIPAFTLLQPRIRKIGGNPVKPRLQRPIRVDMTRNTSCRRSEAASLSLVIPSAVRKTRRW